MTVACSVMCTLSNFCCFVFITWEYLNSRGDPHLVAAASKRSTHTRETKMSGAGKEKKTEKGGAKARNVKEMEE